MGLMILIVWFVIGGGIGIYVTLVDDDIFFKDIPMIFLCGLFGPIMIGMLFSEGILKIPKIFNKDAVLFKKFKDK